jgi:hypothetical protein
MEGAKDITGTPVFYKFLSGFCFAFFPPSFSGRSLFGGFG